MNNEPFNHNEILSRSIPGFHQYCLSEPARVTYASPSLCAMLGMTAEELVADGYLSRVHPADRDAFSQALAVLAREPQTLTVRYRLVKADGSILHVSDAMTSYPFREGVMADSVLTDITELKRESENLRFLDETMPCGFLKYTCEKNPRAIYMNDRMKQILRLPEGEDSLYRQNIFLLVPAEERGRFSRYLDQVCRSETTVAGEITVFRWDGTRARLFGWVTKSVNDRGQEEFQSACMDITRQHQLHKEQETKRYLQALTEVYDKIFEYNLPERTVKCLYAQNSPMFRWIENIPMQMEEATEKWIMGTVFEEDRARVREFFSAFVRGTLPGSDTPPVIRYRAISSGGVLKTYTGLFVKTGPGVSLFCCRSAQETAEADHLRSENLSLKENMQKLVMHFTDGLAAFEIIDDVVTPLYASDNVCQFFGFTREDWLTVMKKRTPIREFVSRSAVAYEAFADLLRKGEAEFTYYDLILRKERRIRAICSEKTPGSGPRYVMLYNVEEASQAACRVQIRTFGWFDVFVEDKPIAFRNEKARELLALLVDRRGGYVSAEEAIGFLWEEESANSVTLSRYRKVALRLKNTLEEYGIGDIVESVNGKRRLATEKVRCDLYDYLSGEEKHAQLFKGSYLTNYSWGETTLAELLGEHLLGEE